MKWLINWFEAIAVAQQKRADYWLLRNMSDKELKDIGITRGEIAEKVFLQGVKQVSHGSMGQYGKKKFV